MGSRSQCPGTHLQGDAPPTHADLDLYVFHPIYIYIYIHTALKMEIYIYILKTNIYIYMCIQIHRYIDVHIGVYEALLN